jgi:nitroreductase
VTQPWRFRLLGPATLAGISELAGEKEAAKLRRAPTLVLATAVLTGDARTDEEDLHATAAAVYAVLLGATERGLASYWRTPACFEEPGVRAAVGLEPGERIVALIHLGPALSEPPAKERLPLAEILSILP